MTTKFESGKTYAVGNRCDRVYFKVVARTAKTATFELVGIQKDASRFDSVRVDVAGNGETQKIHLYVEDDTEFGYIKVTAENAWGNVYTDRVYIEPKKAVTIPKVDTTTEADTTVEAEYKPQTAWENPHDFTTVGNLNGQPRKYVEVEETTEDVIATIDPEIIYKAVKTVGGEVRRTISRGFEKGGKEMWFSFGRRISKTRAAELLAECGFRSIDEFIAAEKVAEQYKDELLWPRWYTNRQKAKFLRDKIWAEVKPCDDNAEVFNLLPALDDLNDVDDEPMVDAKIDSEADTGEEIEMPLVVLKDKLTDLTEQSSQLFNYIHCSDDRQKADAAFKGEMQLICSGRAQSPERRQIEAENEARRARIVVAEAHYSCLQNDCAKLVAAIASNGRITKRNWEVIMDKKPHVLNNTGNCEWYTPPAVIDAVLDVLDEIDLDPASSRIANEIVGAKKFFTRDDDGLKQDWFGNVFLNPPYSKGLIDKFIDKLRAEIIVGHIKEAVVLVNAATDTRWYERAIEPAKGICFTRGRIKFIKPDGSFANQPTCGQVFLYYGRRCDKFFDVFQNFGVCMETIRRRRIFHPEFLTNRFHGTPITKPTKKYSRQTPTTARIAL